MLQLDERDLKSVAWSRVWSRSRLGKSFYWGCLGWFAIMFVVMYFTKGCGETLSEFIIPGVLVVGLVVYVSTMWLVLNKRYKKIFKDLIESQNT